jgi:hypothetical protein
VGKDRRRNSAGVSCGTSLALARAFRGLQALRPLVVYTDTLYSPFGVMNSASLRTSHIWHAREFVRENMRHHYRYRLGTVLSMGLIGGTCSRVISNSVALKEKLAARRVKEPCTTPVHYYLRQEPGAVVPHAGIWAGCALKAHRVQ